MKTTDDFIEKFFVGMEEFLNSFKGTEKYSRAVQIINSAAELVGSTNFESLGILQDAVLDFHNRHKTKLFKRKKNKKNTGKLDLKNPCKN